MDSSGFRGGNGGRGSRGGRSSRGGRGSRGGRSSRGGRGATRGSASGSGNGGRAEEGGGVERGRGVARGRVGGRRGGRGRGGRGRGDEVRIARSDKERLEALWAERKQQMRDVVKDMPVDELRELVLKLIDREPGLVIDLCEGAQAGDNPPPTPEPLQPAWCTCGNCRAMATDLENVCCKCLPRNCVSTRAEIDRLVLDPQVLALGHTYYRAVLARQRERIEDAHKRNRHCAYRNFTLWRWGRLGAGVRRVIPSCCVLRIRAQYPSPTGQYVGYIPGRFY
ncbi:uncharacterized protein LOC127878869 [Dreissena polymorpha]|uniref:uncharacterized protein LOC127878869 n=1 Tax=Dreissena polymorpha TaxID=45954 RepID=UPI00226545A4|nr:uncharacterized protein LOC127878869 [Dreissena polymorpha]